VTEWDPIASEDVENVQVWDAAPGVPGVPVPIDVAPSKNVTEPVGTSAVPLLVTVAVKVTDWPNAEGLADDVIVSLAFGAWTPFIVIMLSMPAS
jgi:hypothetical protein